MAINFQQVFVIILNLAPFFVIYYFTRKSKEKNDKVNIASFANHNGTFNISEKSIFLRKKDKIKKFEFLFQISL